MQVSLLEILSEIPDHRRTEGKRFDLATVLLYAILVMVAGANSYRPMHEFIRIHRQLLNDAFGLELRNSLSYTGLRLILRGVKPAALEAAFRRHASTITKPPATDGLTVIAVDGKTLRGSFDAFCDRKAARMMSALRHADQIVLGHVMVAEKSNESPAAPELIEALGLTNCLFTLDAAHCQNVWPAPSASGLIEGGSVISLRQRIRPHMTDPWFNFAVSLAVGLLIGLERERSKGEGPAHRQAGLRTFELAAVLGASAMHIGGVTLLGVTEGAVAVLAAVSYFRDRDADPGVTTEVGLLATPLFGGLAMPDTVVATGLGVAAAVISAAKTTLHGFVTGALTDAEVNDGPIFAVAIFVIWP